MNLIDALRDSRLDGLDDAATLAAGNETVVIATSSAMWRYAGVAAQFQSAAAEGLYAAILAGVGPGSAATYIEPGINLSLDESQEKLDAIAAAVPALAGLCAALKEIGITHGTMWQSLGVSQPLLADITAARAQIVDQSKKTLAMNALINVQANDPSVTYAQWISNIAAYGVANP